MNTRGGRIPLLLLALGGVALTPHLVLRSSPASADVAQLPHPAIVNTVGYCTWTITQADLAGGTFNLPASGVVCLGQDLNWSTALTEALHVGASTLTLDFGGYTLFCNPETHPFGIKVSGAYDLKIRNGTIQGCAVAIDVASSGNVIIENMLLAYGNHTNSMGISVTGSSNFVVLRKNNIQSFHNPIYATSSGSLIVQDNNISNVTGGDLHARGMDFEGFTGYALVERNVIISTPGHTGIYYSAEDHDVSDKYKHMILRGNVAFGGIIPYTVPDFTLTAGYQNDGRW